MHMESNAKEPTKVVNAQSDDENRKSSNRPLLLKLKYSSEKRENKQI